jgi:hypothetical protein
MVNRRNSITKKIEPNISRIQQNQETRHNRIKTKQGKKEKY